MIARPVKMIVCKEEDPMFAEGNYSVEIVDEGAGEFISLRELTDEEGEVGIEKKDWPKLRETLDIMFNNVKEYE